MIERLTEERHMTERHQIERHQIERPLIERLLIDHCSPTLASLKSANLCAVHYSSEQNLEEQVCHWNKESAYISSQWRYDLF